MTTTRPAARPDRPRRDAVLKLFVLFLALGLPGLQAAEDPVPVQVAPVSEVLIDLERSAPAEVVPLNRSVLAAQVAAPVAAIHADAGQPVSAGDLLIELDPADFALALAQAEATLAALEAERVQARARLERARELGANQYLSADELLARETELAVVAARIQAQRVAVDTATRNLEKTRITAPFDGVVEQRFAQLGGYVVPGGPLVELVETERFELDAQIPAEFAASLEHAEPVFFRSRNERWPVRLLRLSPVVGRERRSRLARFGFDESAPAVGRSGEVVWRVEDGLLPASLVVRRNGRLGVFVADGDTARFHVLPEAQEGRPVPVAFDPGTLLVTAGRDRLQDGIRITARHAKPF